MADKTNGASNSSAIHYDEADIAQFGKIFQGRDDQIGILNGRKPDGKKNQYTLNQAFDAEKHLTGELQQGQYPTRDGQCKWMFADVDQKVDPKEFCKNLFNIDNKAFPFQSPSGRWHVFKFFHKWFPRELISKDAKALEEKLGKIYKVDKGHTLPVKGGWCNLPYAEFEGLKRQCYDPRGNPLSLKQFIHRAKFKNHPLIVAAAGMAADDGRHKALFNLALYCEHVLNKIELLNEINDNFTDPCAAADVERFTVKEYHKSNEKWTKEYLDRNLENYFEDINGFRPEAVNHLDPEFLQPLELYEYTGAEKLEARPWVIPGWIMLKTMTLIVGQPGVGKTILLHMIAYCLANGIKLLGKEVLQPGNVCLICAEETKNEMRLRLKGIEEILGINFKSNNKILIRGLEDELKLVQFGLVEASATVGYKRLKKALVKHNIKYIILDPLISFQTGNYDENSNQKMELYIKTYLLPLAVEINGAFITGHHTNKLSMVQIVDKELVVDQQNAMASARGASALVAAARFIIGMQPMTRKLWEHQFKDHITDGSTFVHYTGIIEAKSNYNVVEDDISWLKKSEVRLDVRDQKTDMPKVEKIGVFTMTDLNKITQSKNKLKAAKNEEFARSHIAIIKKLMGDAEADAITLNSLVSEVAPLDARWSDPEHQESKIKSDVRRRLENGLSGKVTDKKKGGLMQEGIEFDDGYNYWIKRDHSKAGAAKLFICRGKDFKR